MMHFARCMSTRVVLPHYLQSVLIKIIIMYCRNDITHYNCFILLYLIYSQDFYCLVSSILIQVRNSFILYRRKKLHDYVGKFFIILWLIHICLCDFIQHRFFNI